MGEILIFAEGIVVYNGDAEIGVTISIDAIGPAQNITLHKVDTRDSMAINTTRLRTMTGQGIIAGDKITISTVKGRKSITLLRGGIYTNILNTLNKGANWFQLSKGENVFAFEAEQGIENLIFTIENRTLFEGV